MKIFKKAIILLTMLLCIPCFNSCGDDSGTTQNPAVKKKIFYDCFDTVSVIYDYSGMNDGKFEALCTKTEKLLWEYHKLYDIYDEYDGINNLATVNKNAGRGAIKVDKKIIDLLKFSKEMHTLTNGEVNIAMGSVLKIWHEYRNGGYGTALPPMSMLTEANEHTDINAIIIDEVNMTVEITDEKTQIDVGAIAKGYAVEKAAEMIDADGITSVVLDIGGNLRAIGAKPSGDPWRSGIKNPNDPYSSNYVHILNIQNEALVTSGVYERFYTVDGVRYHHIINSETLMPENYYLSVTIKVDSSALADALSTAVFNMPLEEAKPFIESQNGIFAVFVLPDGSVVTAGEE